MILSGVGIIGCIIPALPGPPFNFLAIVLLKLFRPESFSSELIIVFGVITLAVTILDYVFPIMGIKIYKASRYGIWGSIIGMLVGLFFFPPFGMIIGLLIGAVIGEFVAGKNGTEAFRIGLVTFVASIIMIIVKLIISGIMTFYFMLHSVSPFL